MLCLVFLGKRGANIMLCIVFLGKKEGEGASAPCAHPPFPPKHTLCICLIIARQ